MPIPVPIPSGARAITEAENSAAEAFVEAVAQIFEHGTQGATIVTPATLYPDGPDPEHDGLTGKPRLKPLIIDTPEKQLYYRQLALAIVQTITGPGGAVGPPGPPGVPGINWLGTWSPSTTYNANDGVQWGGSSYICLDTNTNSAPPSIHWDLIAAKGEYVPPTPAFTCGLSGGGVLEAGQILTNPSFSASYNRTPTTATLQDNQGNPSLNVLGVANPIVVARSYQKSTADQSVVFTLSATEPENPASASVSYVWRQKAFWGVGVDGLRSSAFITSLANSALTSSKNRTFTVDAYNDTLHIYYAYRAAYGTSTFWSGGFEGGFNGPYTVSVTNAYGVVENYYLYQSVQPGLGPTTITVQ